MTWSYPFSLPAARGGPQPRLSLNYHSSSRDREAGYGWGLDLPVIERKPLSGYPCATAAGVPIACGEQSPTAPSEERYAFSGQPLVLICRIPASPMPTDAACGDEKHPAWARTGGWRYFRLQVEGAFARFYLAESRRYWRMQAKGGELLEFGEPPDASGRGVERDRENARSILRWRLVRHSDTLHRQNGKAANYVEYRWKALGKRGLLFLTDILDTPRAAGHMSDADFAHHTQLSWELPDFPQTHYADPYHATPDLRLARVAVSSMPWSGTGPREVIRSYSLRYLPAQGPTTNVPLSQVFRPWRHTFLGEIQMQGRCGHVEDERGDIPQRGECRGSLTPATRFEYEDGWPGFGIASMTRVQGGPPKAVEQDRVLPFISSVGIVDFNRDGLPDIVQGWKPSLGCATDECDEGRPMIGYLNRGTGIFVNLQHQCFDAGRADDTTGLTHYALNTRDGFFTNRGGATLVAPWSEGVLAWSNAQFASYRARPVPPAYALSLLTLTDTTAIPNTGTAVVIVARIGASSYVRIFDAAGARVHNQRAIEFLPEQTLALIDDAFAAPLPPQMTRDLTEQILSGTAYDRPFDAGSGCDVDNFSAAAFKPGWKWEKTQSAIDWAKPPVGEPPAAGEPTGGHGRFFRLPRWFVDVDGDGLVDRMDSTGEQALDFETAYVQFTQRYPKGAALPGGGTGPAQIPFVFDGNQRPHSLVPSFAGSESGTRYWYVDINGDGLVDLVTYNPGGNGGIPQVRPGNGRGGFSCIDVLQPWACQEPSQEVARIYGIDVAGPIKPWPFNDETLFHDVTGDGLADIVRYDMPTGEVRVWVNQDGHAFACAIASCVAGKVLNAHAEERGLSGAAAWDIGEHRTTFADMNADGIDDIVVLARTGAYVGVFMEKYVVDSSRGSAPRPGLLIRIHNGYGATTDIQYQSIQQLDLDAAKDPVTAWRWHVPVVDAVVTQITTQDTYHAGGDSSAVPLSAPYQFKRMAQYLYQDPAYDRWSRSFVGFRKVSARYGIESATTTATYAYGNCQNNRLNARLPSTPDIPLCEDGSDDDDYKSLSGRIVRIDRGNEFLGVFNQRFATPRFAPPPVGGPKLLWTRMFHYTQVTLFQTPERRVTFAYPGQIDSFLYDDAQPTSSAGGASPGFGAGGDRLQDAPHQKNVRKHLRQVQEYDTRGVLRRTVDHGAIKDADSAPADREDATVVTLFSSGDPATSNDAALIPCTEDWVCQPSYVSVWQPQPGGPFDTLLRKSRFTYNASQDVESVSDWLDEAAPPLDRHHPAGAANVAPAPPGQSLARGWHTLLTATYDPFGNIVKAAATPSAGGSPAECTTFEPDRAYAQLTEFVRKFVDGCGGQAHTFQTVYDRGFGLVTQVRDAGGGLSAVRYDALGRPLEIHRPAPDDRPGAPPVLSETFTYSDRAPLSHVESRRFVGPGTAMRSVTILNGLGEPVLRFNKGDAGGDWILSEWTETDLSGRVRQIRRPWITTSDPVASAASASAFAIPVDNALLEIQYDGFGRRVSLKETAGGVTQELSRIAYSPLAMEVRDAEQLKSGSVHSSAFQRIEFDGRGRNVLSKVHVANPAADDIITRVDYAPTGEVVKASRVHRGGSYERTMKYDTLGRLVRNEEPNTGKNWRYVWDGSGRLVGMSDARGCGENFYYDGLNRLVGEDYSPCLASQPAYTAPDLDTGAGFEALYRYDSYEADQIQPEPGFADDARAAIGRLVSFSDRGSHTRFNYDARGRLRRIARQVATPGSTGADSFAQHWFSSRMDYDIGDRVTRRTTGADIPELLVAGSSEERYAYSPRGNLMSVDSSYGSLIKSASFDARDAPTRIVFGDARSTTARFAYDARHRLSMYQLIAPSTPAAPPIGYFDYRFPEYDAVGNPLVIQDLRIAWTVLPADAAPVETRKMDYDDLYRVTGVANAYKTFDGTAPWSSPFAAENAAGDTRPLPLRSLPKRITRQQFTYDGLGNLTASSDDASAVFDRSLGPGLAYGTAQDGPNQLRSGNGLKLRYDAAGNMTELTVERPGTCPSGAASACAQRFVYDWDEVGQLARARRWDFPGNSIPASSSPAVNVKPAWDLAYAYSQGGRVRKTVTDPAGDTRHTLEIFDTLRVNSAAFDAAARDYRANRRNMQTYLAGMGQAFWDDSGVLPHQPGTSGVTMHLSVGDHLGSSSVVINHATSELVERSTYQPYGAVESDHRPAKWRNFRDAYKFTGKEEDIEAGIVYFGARYYQPYLGRFISADPLTVHGMGADMNPYGYVSGRVTTRIDPIGLAECTPGTMCMPEGQPEDVITGRRPPPDPTPSSDPTPPNTPGLPGPSAPSAGTAGSATGSAPKAPREMLTFERGDPNAIQKPTRGDLIKAAVVQVAQDTALNLVDPVHTNRHFVKDIITITDDKASPLSKGIAGGSAVLSVIPVVGELRVGSVALKEIAASARTSEELARLVSLVGNSGPQQTVAVLETAEGIRLVGAGVRDLSPAQRIFARAYGLVPVKLAGAHAEGTVLEAAWFKGLRPLRGVTTVDACPVCAPMLKDGSFGWIFEYVTPRIFIVK